MIKPSSFDGLTLNLFSQNGLTLYYLAKMV